MKEFFSNDVLLHSQCAKVLYEGVKDLPIIDYHCHLDEKMIAADRRFFDIGALWLESDHYKFRAMRLMGIDEKYITGDATYQEKFRKYASVMPALCANPLYYFSHMELSQIFGITKPLSEENADEIFVAANAVLANMKVSDILEKFNVEYIATTDDPCSPLSHHGQYGVTKVCPTFRPDRFLRPSKALISELTAASGKDIKCLDSYICALEDRLDYFITKGCGISDHGMDFLPLAECPTEYARELFERCESLTENEADTLSSYLLYKLARTYSKRGIVMQIHFGTFRRVNTEMTKRLGADMGFDVMRSSCDIDRLAIFFDTLDADDALPRTVLYSLNPQFTTAAATLSGAFPGVLIGAAWWFNDTLAGIKKNLEIIAEYAALGSSLGMLTDSRSFASYVRFDFFRRILADFVGEKVECGEYCMEHAEKLMYDVCYGNVKKLLKI